PADGTNPYMATSRTRMPSNGFIGPLLVQAAAGQRAARTRRPPPGYHPRWSRAAMAYRSPRHVDNFILISGESYIPRTRIQPNGRNETAILIDGDGTWNSQCLRRKNAVYGPPCE